MKPCDTIWMTAPSIAMALKMNTPSVTNPICEIDE